MLQSIKLDKNRVSDARKVRFTPKEWFFSFYFHYRPRVRPVLVWFEPTCSRFIPCDALQISYIFFDSLASYPYLNYILFDVDRYIQKICCALLLNNFQ